MNGERNNREAEIDKERDQASDGLKCSDLNVVAFASGTGGDKLLFDTLIADSTQNPEAMPYRILPDGIALAYNFDVISGFNEFFESRFCNHIRRFFC